MPAKKKTKETPPQTSQETIEETEEPENSEDQRFQQMENRLTQKFESQFLQFQKAIEKIAKDANESNKPAQKKKGAQQAKNPHDTRNKALREKYNPEMEVDPDNNTHITEVLIHHDNPATGNAMTDKDPDQAAIRDGAAHALQAGQNVNIRPTHTTTFSEPNKQAYPAQTVPNPAWQGFISTDKNKDMNQWLINKALALQPASTSQMMPMSTRDFHDDDDLDMRVQTILANTASGIARGNARPGLFPYKYVFRGDDLKRATMNSLSISDHCWAIFRMIRDEVVPQDIKPYLYSHVEQVLEDSRSYNWQAAVRPWSNEVFSRVAEGRFSNGWASHGEIQLLRISMSQTSTAKLSMTSDAPHSGRQQQSTFTNKHLRGGPQCLAFNSQKGCNLQSGHIVNGQKLIHICAYCLFNSSVARPHSEFYCRNRQRQTSNNNHF